MSLSQFCTLSPPVIVPGYLFVWRFFFFFCSLLARVLDSILGFRVLVALAPGIALEGCAVLEGQNDLPALSPW